MKRILINLAKAIIALPYRIRVASLGRSVRIMPPLLLLGAKWINIGDRVIMEQFVGMSVMRGGEIRIGNDCELRCFSRFEAHDGKIQLGNRCSVNPFALLSGYGVLMLGDDVRVGSHCVILSSTHRFESTDLTIAEQGAQRIPTTIENDVWLGSGCTVLGGVRIGHGSIVGSGAVVTHDLPPWSIASGVPARVTRIRGSVK